MENFLIFMGIIFLYVILGFTLVIMAFKFPDGRNPNREEAVAMFVLWPLCFPLFLGHILSNVICPKMMNLFCRLSGNKNNNFSNEDSTSPW